MKNKKERTLKKRIQNNLSNYLAILGIILIVIFTFMKFGLACSFLAAGIFLIVISIIIELNNLAKSKNTRW